MEHYSNTTAHIAEVEQRRDLLRQQQNSLLELDQFESAQLLDYLHGQVEAHLSTTRLGGVDGALYAWATERYEDFEAIVNGSEYCTPLSSIQKTHLYLRSIEAQEIGLMAALDASLASLDATLHDIEAIDFYSKVASLGVDRSEHAARAVDIIENSLTVDRSDPQHRMIMIGAFEQLAVTGRVTQAAANMEGLGFSHEVAQVFAASAYATANEKPSPKIDEQADVRAILDILDLKKRGFLHDRKKRESTLLETDDFEEFSYPEISVRILSNYALAGSQRAGELLKSYAEQHGADSVPHLKGLALRHPQDWFEPYVKCMIDLESGDAHPHINDIIVVAFRVHNYEFLSTVLADYIHSDTLSPYLKRGLIMTMARMLSHHQSLRDYSVEEMIDVDLHNEIRIRTRVESLYSEVHHQIKLDTSDHLDQIKQARHVFDSIDALLKNIDALVDEGDQFRYTAMLLEIAQILQRHSDYYRDHTIDQRRDLASRVVNLASQLLRCQPGAFSNLSHQKIEQFMMRLGFEEELALIKLQNR